MLQYYGILGMPHSWGVAAQFLLVALQRKGVSLRCEAVACKLPVITTRYGGHLDYLNEENSYLIDCDMVPAPRQMQYLAYHPDALMAEPRLSHLRQLMRQVKTDYDQALKKAELAYEQCAGTLTWENAADKLIALVRERGWEI